MVTRRITYRLYPTKAQEQKLHYWRRLHCSLWNAAVYHRKTEYQRFCRSVSYLAQQNCLPAFKECWSEYIELGSQALQNTLKRVDFAYQRFFNGLGKYPRFKASRRYPGWTYPGSAGWKVHTTGLNGHLELSNLGIIQMCGQARAWGRPTTCTICWKAGKWYASITVECEPVRATGTGAAGIDLGCETAVTLWDGEKATEIENPRFLAKTQEKVRRASRQLRRKRKPEYKKKIQASRRWKKQNARVSRLKQKVANQRQNWWHQKTAEIVSSHSLVGAEELNVKPMTKKAKKGSKRKRQKAGLNRSILDVGMSDFMNCLEYKLQEAGGFLIKIPTKVVKPSQTCPSCYHQKKKELSERIHQCEKCGYTVCRDVAAAQICYQHLTSELGTSLDNARGDLTSTSRPKERKNCGGWKQVKSKKRETPPSAEGKAG